MDFHRGRFEARPRIMLWSLCTQNNIALWVKANKTHSGQNYSLIEFHSSAERNVQTCRGVFRAWNSKQCCKRTTLMFGAAANHVRLLRLQRMATAEICLMNWTVRKCPRLAPLLNRPSCLWSEINRQIALMVCIFLACKFLTDSCLWKFNCECFVTSHIFAAVCLHLRKTSACLQELLLLSIAW